MDNACKLQDYIWEPHYIQDAYVIIGIDQTCSKMVFRGIILFLVLGMSLSYPQDLSGKMFTFPLETGWANVRITTSRQYLAATTLCFRYFTDLTREFGMFSMATSTHQNSFTIFKKARTDHIQLFVRDALAEFYGQEYKINTWQSLCSTWDSSTGLTQLWLNGIPSTRKFTTTAQIYGALIIILGQEQDSHGGSFDIKQSFVGMTADLHMWDYVLSPNQILSYHNHNNTEGNLLSWGSLEFHKTSRVEIEDAMF